MRKIPTLFERVFDGHKIVDILPNVTPGMEWVLKGEGKATIKWDGSCCAIIDGEFYRRYDAKNGKPVPEGAIKWQEEADPITGHLPCWVKCDRSNPNDHWYWKAYDTSSIGAHLADGTYEAVGLHFRNNPYNHTIDSLIRHGTDIIPDFPRTFDEIREYLRNHHIEGVVFWKDGQPQCKIKRSDFGFEWNPSVGRNKNA
jgi:hypothetical protein